MKRILVLSVALLLTASLLGVAAPFQFFQTSRNVAVFSNTSTETYVGLRVIFADEVDPLYGIALGAVLERTDAPVGELAYRGIVPPVGGFEIDWILDGPRVLAAYWIRENGAQVEIDIHSPTAKMIFIPPMGTDVCCDTGTCVELTPVEVEFSSTGSVDPDGVPLVLYEWTWSDGLRMEGRRVERVFTLSGEYVVVLVVWDAEGLSDVTTRTFYIPRYTCIPD